MSDLEDACFPLPHDKTNSPVRFWIAKRVVCDDAFLFSSFLTDEAITAVHNGRFQPLISESPGFQVDL